MCLCLFTCSTVRVGQSDGVRLLRRATAARASIRIMHAVGEIHVVDGWMLDGRMAVGGWVRFEIQKIKQSR